MIVNGVVDPATTGDTLRFCFGLGNGADGGGAVSVAGGIFPFPDTSVAAGLPAGLPPGTGGSTANSKQLAGFNLASLTISLYALDGKKIANDTAAGGPDGSAEIPCEGLVGTDALGVTGKGGGTLTAGTDFWYLGTIPKGTLEPGTSWLAAVVGCKPGETSAQNAALCPTTPAYSATTGNLSLLPLKLDSTTTVSGGIGAQFAHVSAAWDAVMALNGGAHTAAGFYVPTPTVVAEGGVDSGDASTDAASDAVADAGAPPPSGPTDEPITLAANFGDQALPAQLAIIPNTTEPLPVTFDGNSGFFATWLAADGGAILYPSTCSPELGNCLSPLLYPLPTVAELTFGLTDAGTPPNVFANGTAYIFVLVGDPTATGPLINVTNGQPCGTPSATCVFNTQFPHFLAFPTL